MPTCPATPTSSGPSPCCWPTTSWPTAGRCARDVDRLIDARPPPRRVSRSAPAPWPARRCRSTPSVAADARLRRAPSTTRSTPSATGTSSPRRSSTWRCSASHLSRLGEEVVLWSTEEFGFLTLDRRLLDRELDAARRRRTPTSRELARGKAGRLIGHLTGLLATLKGLPLAYNRDLQEDKEPLFDALDQVTLALAAMTGLLARSTFETERDGSGAPTARTAAATDLAEYLVRRACRSAHAHAVVGALVRQSLEGGGALVDLVAQHESLGPDAVPLLDSGASVRRRTTLGGAGPQAVADQMVRFRRKRLATDRSRVEAAH